MSVKCARTVYKNEKVSCREWSVCLVRASSGTHGPESSALIDDYSKGKCSLASWGLAEAGCLVVS